MKWSFDPQPGREDAVADAHPRVDVLGARRRSAHLLRRAPLALRARRAHGQAASPASDSDGRIDLREGFRERDPRAVSVGVNTPGVFYGDLLILGSIVPEGLPSAPGDIRAFDVHTGAQKWAFHTIPHPGEFGYDTWPKDAWKYTRRRQRLGRAVARREARAGLCLDRVGGLRLLRRQPARRQPVREHDPVPPRGDRRARVALPGREARRLGSRLPRARRRSSRSPGTAGRATSSRRSPRTAAPTSSTARPASRSSRWRRSTAPASDVPGERLVDDAGAADAAAAVHAAEVHRGHDHQAHAEAAHRPCARQWLKLRKGGEFDPPSVQGTVLFPGMDGGGEWGGAAFDPNVRPAVRQRERDGVDA